MSAQAATAAIADDERADAVTRSPSFFFSPSAQYCAKNGIDACPTAWPATAIGTCTSLRA